MSDPSFDAAYARIQRRKQLAFGNRPDGTPKGTGWLGVQKSVAGNAMTEYSVGLELDGQQMDVPTLVPGLTDEELEHLKTEPNLREPSPLNDAVVRKAEEHARKMLSQGRSVFAPPPSDPENQQGKLRGSLYAALPQNPDDAAKAKQISRASGLPQEVVERNLPQAERQQRLISYEERLKGFPQTGKFLSDPRNAKVAHDDVGNMSSTEASVRALRGPQATFGSYLYGLYRSVAQGGELARQGVRQQFADLIGSKEMLEDASRKYAAASLDQAATTPEFDSPVTRGIYGGFSSFLRQVPLYGAAIALRNPNIALAPMALQTEAEAYGKYRGRGGSAADALYGAVHEGAIEYFTEKIPMKFAVDTFGKAGTGKFLAGLLGREIPSEQLATLTQDAIDTAVANPDKTWGQFFAERPEAAVETLFATLSQAGASGAIHKAATTIAGREQQAAGAEDNAKLLGILDGLAKASKVRQRDPATFEDFVKQASEAGPVKDIYVNAATFAQSMQDAGVDINTLAEATPAIKEQLKDALATGGDLKIPIEQYATSIAGTEFSQTLIPHLKTEAGGMSQLEAATFMQNHGQELEAEVNRVLEEKKGDDTFKASRDAVVADIREKLNTAGRFTDDVNLAKASLVGNFYAVMGARLGLTAEEMAQKYPLEVQATVPGSGNAMDQKYPMQDPPEYEFSNYKELGGRIVHMTPDQYLDATKPLTIDEASQDNIDDLIRMMREGRKIDAPRLTLEGDKVAAHDGRHRAHAAKALGVEQMPVLLMGGTPETVGAIGQTGTPITFNQSVTLRTGKEKLKIREEKSRGFFLTRDLAKALEARQRKKYGTIARDDQSDEAAKRIAKWMVDEVLFELEHPEDSGLGWYTTKFQGALDMIGQEEFPELLTDKSRRDLLTVIFGVTSNGADPADNMVAALEIYEGFRNTGKFTLSSGHNRDYASSLADLQELYDNLGPEGMHEYLMQESTVKELKKIAQASGRKPKSDYQPHIVLPMAAALLGPKLGAFYANLMGALGYLTMDRWWSRTFNRMRGQLLTHPTAPGKAKVKGLLGNPGMTDEEMLKAIAPVVQAYAASNYEDKTDLNVAANTVWKAAHGTQDAPFGVTDRTFMIKAVKFAQEALARKGQNLSIADIQAVLWYYEKRLYAELGATPSGTDSYYEVARRALDLRADARAGIDRTGGSAAPRTRKSKKLNEQQGVGPTRPEDDTSQDPTFNQSAPGIPGTVDRTSDSDASGERGRRADSERPGTPPPLPRPHESLTGLPSTSPGAIPAILDAAAAYMRSAGLPPVRQTKYVAVDKIRATAIANAYSEMAHDPNDPDVAEAYQAMIAETLAQFQIIKQLGIKIEFIRSKDPYTKGPIEALYDLRDNNHLWVFPTESGFGTENLIDISPLLAPTDEVIDGHRLLVNDVFRIVHDVFGHAKEGNGFGPVGEENAWQSHAIMYSPLALKAMTSETRGQNSWVNFGPHGEHNRANPKDTIYADQKVGLLPDWVSEDGRSPTMAVADNTFEQPLLTDTSAFKTWFGDSKVVDAYGNPKVMYHGSPKGGFAEFDVSNVGVFFTERFDVAASYAGTYDDVELPSPGAESYDENQGVYSGYLKIENPLVLDWGGRAWGEGPEGLRLDDWVNRAKRAGHDGVIVDNVHDTGWLAPGLVDDSGNGQIAVVFKPTQIKSATDNKGTFDPGNPSILEQGARGSIRFADDITAAPSIISLLNNADLSTFLHESGHFFLQVMADMATRPGAPANVTADMNALLSWFGIQDLAAWNAMTTDEQRPYHESFARGFETYLMEGKPPVPELAPLFQRFRAWMLNVYKHILQLAKGDAGQAMQVNLTSEVRGVMDRMLATSETIKEAEDAQGFAPLFETRPDGMTPEEWEWYQWLGQDATQEAIHELESRSMRDMKWASNAKAAVLKRMQAEVEDKRSLVRAEVTAEVMAEPINRVRTFLRDGEIDGMPVPGPSKISVQALEEMYGGDGDRYALLDWKSLSARGATSQEGLHPDELAADFGFPSGDALVQALLEEDTAKQKIDELTDQRMLERYGDLNSEANLARAADAAIHNDARIRFVATELNALNKAAGRKPLLAAAAKAFADLAISRKKVRDLIPHEYAAAARRAANAAAKAMKAGDLQTAAVEKRNQLVNEYAAQAAHKALAEVDKQVRYLKRVGSTNSQKKMRGQGAAQLLAILDRFDLRKASLKEIDKRTALAEWAADEANRLAAPPPLLTQKVLDEANRTHYKNLTLEDFRGLVDSVKQLEHLARREYKAFIELRNLTIQAEVAKGVEEIRTAFPEAFEADGTPKLKTPLTNKYAPSLGKTMQEGVRNIIAEFIPMEDLIDRLTAGKFGQLQESLFGRLSNASDAKAKMAADVRERIKPLIDAYTFREKRDFARKEIPGTNMTRENIVMLALHWGNVEGRQRLESQGFTETRVAERLKHLTAKDIDLIRGIWDLNDNFIWPQYAELNMRTQGKAPAKVAPSPFTFTTVAGGQVTLQGGYIKLVYDSDFDESTRQRDSMADAMSMISGRTGANPKTDQGSSQERVAELSKMPLLEMRAVAQAVNEHMHDIHFREAVADTVRLLREPAMRDAIKAVAGKEVYTELLAKVNEVAARPVEPSGAVLRALNIARRNTIVTLMSGIKTALVNYTGLLPALTRLSPGAILKNTAKVHSYRAKELIRFSQAKSSYMRERNNAFTSDLQHQFNAMSVKNRILPEMSTFLILMRMVDQMTSTSVWLAGYEDGVRRFKHADGTVDETRAIQYADNITRSTQGSGRELDTSKIMTRFGPWARMFTMFYSFFNKQAALLARQGLIAERHWKAGNKAKAVGMFTASYVAIVVIPAMINDIAAGRCDDAIEGDEGWARCTARALTMNMAGFVPILRDVAPYAWSLVDDKEPTYGLKMTSISAFFEGVAKGGASTVEVLQGEADDKDVKPIFMGLSYSFGLPGLLMWNVLAGSNAFLEGDAGPQAVLFGPPKK